MRTLPSCTLHGGNFVLGSAYGYRPLVAALAMAAGRGALVPDFRLAPEHPFPAALDNALAAYRWLAGQRGGASEVVLAGDSSGAGLALDLTRLPPLLIQYASGDRARPEAEALVNDARHAGVDVRVERYAPNGRAGASFPYPSELSLR